MENRNLAEVISSNIWRLKQRTIDWVKEKKIKDEEQL